MDYWMDVWRSTLHNYQLGRATTKDGADPRQKTTETPKDLNRTMVDKPKNRKRKKKKKNEIMSAEKVTHKQWIGLTGPTLKGGQTWRVCQPTGV